MEKVNVAFLLFFAFYCRSTKFLAFLFTGARPEITRAYRKSPSEAGALEAKDGDEIFIAS